MTDIASMGGEAGQQNLQAEQLLKIVEQMSPETRETFARALGVKPVRKKPQRTITNEDIKRQALMVGEVSHGEDFEPAFSDSVTQAIAQYPKLRRVIMERWQEGQPISHSSLEFDEEIQEIILRERPMEPEGSEALMERMGPDYVQAVEGSEDAAEGLAGIAQEEFDTSVLEGGPAVADPVSQTDGDRVADALNL